MLGYLLVLLYLFDGDQLLGPVDHLFSFVLDEHAVRGVDLVLQDEVGLLQVQFLPGAQDFFLF